jgi:hypothetical protein
LRQQYFVNLLFVSKLEDPAQVETPDRIVGVQRMLVVRYRIGRHLQEPVLVVYAEQKADFCLQADGPAIAEVEALEVVTGAVTYLHIRRAAARRFYRAVEEVTEIEAEPDYRSAPIEFRAEYEFDRHVYIMQGIFSAGLKSVGNVVVASGAHAATGADIFDSRPDVQPSAGVQGDVDEDLAVKLCFRTAALGRDVATGVRSLHGIRELGKIRTSFDANGDLSIGVKGQQNEKKQQDGAKDTHKCHFGLEK